MAENSKSEGSAQSSESTGTNLQFSIDKITLWQIIAGVMLIALVSSILTGGFGLIKQPGCDGNNGNDGNVNQLQTIAIDSGSNPLLGKTDAPVAFIEFSDYQCPFCARQYAQSITNIETNYVKNGKVKLYFRDYPLSFHDKAFLAAQAARCAGEKGKFWEMHDKLFQNNGVGDNWPSLSTAEATEKFIQYSGALGLNAEEFKGCINSGKYNDKINADMQAAQNAGVGGTPTTFIIIPKARANMNALQTVAAQYSQNIYLGKDEKGNVVAVVIGAVPYSTYQSILDSVNYS